MAKKLKLTANNSSTMYDLAKVFGTTIDELKKYNKLDSNIIKSGQEFYWETDDVEGVKKRLSDLQKYRQNKYEKDKAAYDKELTSYSSAEVGLKEFFTDFSFNKVAEIFRDRNKKEEKVYLFLFFYGIIQQKFYER